jgi:hypothetical protein
MIYAIFLPDDFTETLEIAVKLAQRRDGRGMACTEVSVYTGKNHNKNSVIERPSHGRKGKLDLFFQEKRGLDSTSTLK